MIYLPMLKLFMFSVLPLNALKASLLLLCTVFSFNSFAQQAVLKESNLEQLESCGVHLISRESVANDNRLLHYGFSQKGWSAPVIVHESPSTFSKRPSLIQSRDGGIVAVWVERDSNGSQLVYKNKKLGAQWPEKPIVITTSGGQKTAPIIFSSMSGQVYLAWASDQNGNDDIFFSSWSGSAWSSPESLSDTNKNPDISPVFSYEKNSQGGFDLVLVWQQRNEDGIYQDASFFVEYDLELDPQLLELNQYCSEAYEKFALPADVKSGFVFRNYSLLDNHQRIRPRFR